VRHLPIEYLPNVEVDTGVNVCLSHPPTTQNQASLSEVVNRWYGRGLAGAFGGRGLHQISGPSIDGSVMRWRIDFGSANFQVAVEALTQDLGAIPDFRVMRLIVGVEHIE
jgi:hypothetical protein